MSLIIDSLKKLKRTNSSKPLPPNLKIENKNRIRKKLFILTGIIILLSASLSVLKFFEDSLILTEKSHFEPTKIEADHKKAVLQKEEKKHPEKKIVKNTPSDRKIEKTGLVPQTEKKKVKQTEKKTTKDTVEKADIKSRYVLYVATANRYLKNKEYQKSLELYQKAYRIKPTETLLAQIVILKIKSGKEKIEKDIANIKDVKNLYKVAVTAINSGRPHLIKDILKKRLLYDSSGIINYLLGIIYEKEGKLKHAEKAYEKAFKQNPSNPYISYAYGRILEINGHYSLSRKIYEHTLKIIKNRNTELWKIVSERLETSGGGYE